MSAILEDFALPHERQRIQRLNVSSRTPKKGSMRRVKHYKTELHTIDEVCKPQPETCKPQPETCKPQPETCKSQTSEEYIDMVANCSTSSEQLVDLIQSAFVCKDKAIVDCSYEFLMDALDHLQDCWCCYVVTANMKAAQKTAVYLHGQCEEGKWPVYSDSLELLDTLLVQDPIDDEMQAVLSLDPTSMQNPKIMEWMSHINSLLKYSSFRYHARAMELKDMHQLLNDQFLRG
jgi:hypothetical protein